MNGWNGNWNRRAARSLAIAGLGLGLLGLAGPAGADWADDFNNGGFAASWIFVTLDDAGNEPPPTGVSTFEIVEAGADDYLRMSHSTTAFQDGGGGATDAFGFVNEFFSDMAITADINAEPLDGQQNLLAVIGRGDPFTGNAYVAGVDFANSFFAIGRNDDLFGFIVPLATDLSVAIDRNETYRVQLFLLGSNVVARLIELSTGTIVSSLTTVDFAYSSGAAGILLQTEYSSNDVPVAPIIGTFDNVRTVPEPSFPSLVGWGIAFVALFSGKRSKLRASGRIHAIAG